MSQEFSEQSFYCSDDELENEGDRTILISELKDSDPSIVELFTGKSVLVTGATGFLGKVLVEKLLRSCVGIKEILILIRPTEKGSAETRLEEYRNNSIFERIRKEKPVALTKLKVLSGDVTKVNLGLADSQLRKVVTDANFVFHCAANVRFEDEASKTISINLVGVQNIMNVCKKCEQLQAFVHVSTAYSFCNHRLIAEQIYPELVRPENLINASEWMTEEQLRTTCSNYVNGRPSFYHFSKAMAEILLVETEHDLPAIIVRPSIVTASMNEPYPGWIDNYNGPSGFIYVCGKGIVKTLLVEEKVNADWVPVDLVANTLIASAHYIAVKSKHLKESTKLKVKGKVPIVNCTCPHRNSITWMKIVKICLPLLKKYPSMDIYGKPGGTVTPHPFIYNTCKLFYHYLPAIFIDGISYIIWQQPRMIGLYRNIHRVMGYLEYYTTCNFKFSSSNMRKLVEQMEVEDRKVFPIDQSSLNWKVYMENYVLGVRRYFGGEKDDTLPSARKRMVKMNCVWLSLKLLSFIGMLAFLKSLHRSGHLKTSLLPSFSVVAYATVLRDKYRNLK